MRRLTQTANTPPPRNFTVKVVVDASRALATNYITARQTAERRDLSRAWVQRLAQQGRIAGAFKIGHTWCIPADWAPPTLKPGRPFASASKGVSAR